MHVGQRDNQADTLLTSCLVLRPELPRHFCFRNDRKIYLTNLPDCVFGRLGTPQLITIHF